MVEEWKNGRMERKNINRGFKQLRVWPKYYFDALGKKMFFYSNADHIHVLCTLPRTITIAELISKIKTSSTKWIKKQGITNFSWQGGYGAFSVSSSKVRVVERYIQNQPQHHKKISFKDELRKFLNEYNIDFDERYLWD